MLPSIKKHLESIKLAERAIDKIQSKCKHPSDQLEKIYNADTGNYDPSNDRYWANFKCFRCGKFWSCNSDEAGYRQEATVVKTFSKD